MQIQVNPAGLSQAQREAVAGFILAYPANAAQQVNVELNIDTTEAKAAITDLTNHVHTAGVGNGNGVTTAPSPAIADMVKDENQFQAEVAFSHPVDTVAAAAFGAPQAPLSHGAISAPSIVDAGQSLIAPEATAAISSTPAMIAPAPPVPTSENVAQVAAPPTVNHASGVEIDKHGLPWDARIHASTKRKNADGSWTAKRGVDHALVMQVEADLRALMSAAPAPVVVPAVPAPAPAPAPDASQDARAQFVALVGRASAAIQSGKVTQAEIAECCTNAGVPGLPLLANRLDLVATVSASVDALIATKQ
jgi:lipoprotein-anchoring transpeptidase ErfK/SrfK